MDSLERPEQAGPLAIPCHGIPRQGAASAGCPPRGQSCSESCRLKPLAALTMEKIKNALVIGASAIAIAAGGNYLWQARNDSLEKSCKSDVVAIAATELALMGKPQHYQEAIENCMKRGYPVTAS